MTPKTAPLDQAVSPKLTHSSDTILHKQVTSKVGYSWRALPVSGLETRSATDAAA
jgi:hypothetical protein